MKISTTQVLVFINLLIFGLIGLLHFFSTDQQTKLASLPLSLVVQNIEHIEIENYLKNTHHVLQKGPSGWQIAHPVNWKANVFSVQAILNQLAFAEPRANFSIADEESTPKDQDVYGVQAPLFRFTFKTRNDQTYTLKIGKQTLAGDHIYCLLEETGEIVIYPKSLVETLVNSSDSLLEPKIFETSLFELNQIDLESLTPYAFQLSLQKNGDAWNFIKPVYTQANGELVYQAMGQIVSAELVSFVDPNGYKGIDLGFESPMAQITLKSAFGEETLRIGSICQEERSENGSKNALHYAKLNHNAAVFTVLADPFFELQRAHEELRDKQLLKFSIANVTDLSIRSEANSIKLAKISAGNWQLFTDQNQGALRGTPADYPTIQSILQALRNLEAFHLINQSTPKQERVAFGFERPQYKLEILEDGRMHNLILGGIDPISGLLYAKIHNSAHVYLVAPEILDFLPSTPQHYWKRSSPIIPAEAKIHSIQLTKASSSSDAQPENPIEITLQNTDWVEALKAWHVGEYVDEPFQQTGIGPYKNFEKTPWHWTLTVQYSDPQNEPPLGSLKTFQCLFTKRLSGTVQLGALPEKALCFQLSKEWMDRLHSLEANVQ